MLGRALVSFLNRSRQQRRRPQQQASASSQTGSGEDAAAAAPVARKRSRREYEEEEEDAWGTVEEHVPYHLAKPSAPSASASVSMRAPTPYTPAPEPAPGQQQQQEDGEQEQGVLMDPELVFDRKVQEILEATEWAAKAQAQGGDVGDVIVLPPLMKRHKPAPGADDGLPYLGLDAATSTDAATKPPEVYVSFDDIFSSDGDKTGKENEAAEKEGVEEEGSQNSSTHSSPLFPRTNNNTCNATAASAEAGGDGKGNPPAAAASSKSQEPAAPGVEWTNVWAAALGLPAPSAFAFRGTVGYKALAAPALFPSWAAEAAAAGTQKEENDDDDDLDHLFGRPAPPPLKPRDPSEPSIWERAEPLVNCSLALGPEGCRTRAGPCAQTGVSLFGLEGHDIAWDTSELHSVTLYPALACLGGRRLLAVTKPSLRPPWSSPRLDVVALAVDPEEGGNGAALRAFEEFLEGEAQKRVNGTTPLVSSSASVGLDARALLAAKVRVVGEAEAHKRAELPHLLDLVTSGWGGGGNEKKAKRD